MSKQLYDFKVHIKRTTPKALLVNNGIQEAWLPRSQTIVLKKGDIEVGDTVTIFLEEWLASQKEFI